METKAGVGWSKNKNPKVAGFEASEKALYSSGIDKPDFVFLFSTVGYDQKSLLDTVRKATFSAPLCGCSGEGIVASGFIDESNFSVVVIAIKSDEVKFINGLSRNLSKDPEGVGCTLAENINNSISEDCRGLFMFPDFNFNFDRLLTSFQENLDRKEFFPVWGAVASDNFKFNRSFQYYNDEISNDGISWAVISGDISIESVIAHGCCKIGIEHTITKCHGNVIEEIDSRVADDVLSDYLTQDVHEKWDKSHTRAEIYAGFVVSKDEKEQTMVRSIIGGRDSQSGSIIIPSEFDEGTKIHLMRRDPDLITSSFGTLGEELKVRLNGRKPKLIFQFECAGRGKIILRDNIRLESINKLQHSIGNDIPWAGFYCLGEIAPINDKNYFHNSTTVITAIV